MIDIFQESETGVFKNKSALHIGYVPNKLISRDEQIMQVAKIVQPIFTDGYFSSGLEFGKTGSGKTVVTRYVLKQLSRKAKKEAINIKSIIISCNQTNTPRRVLIEMLEAIEPEKRCKRGMDTAEYYSQLWDLLNEKELSIILVLDEIDQMRNLDLLYAFSRVKENQNIDSELSIGVIGISNNLHFKNKLDPRILSSFTPSTILFPPYNAVQIKDILQDRVKLAFKHNVLDPSVVPLCAALSAQEHGDARLALKLLLTSGEVADNASSGMLLESHVRAAHENMNLNCLFELVKTLPYQAKITLYSIIESVRTTGTGTVTTGEVTQMYRRVCERLGVGQAGRSTVSVRITELGMLGFINTSAYNIGRGRTRRISLTEDPFKLTRILMEDPIFETAIKKSYK